MNIRATAHHFSFLASCITGYDVTVNVTNDPSYVGFTKMPSNGKANITLSYATPLYSGLSEPKTLMMMLGVLAHECMHLCYTNFDAYNLKEIVLSRKSDKETFHEISNIVEDPAIEFAASNKIGGKMLKALSSVIKHTWMTSPNIEDQIPAAKADEYAYTQVIRALIQLGDRGVIKGKFLSQSAEKAFRNVFSIFNEAIVESDGAKRAELCTEIYKILEPLSRKEAEQSKSMESGSLISMPEGMGEGENTGLSPDDTDNVSNQLTSAQRKHELRKKLEQALNNSKMTGDDGDISDKSKNIDKNNPNNHKISVLFDERPYEASAKNADDLTGVDDDMEFTEDDYETLINEIEQVASQILISEATEKILATKSASELPIDSPDVINIVANNPNEERYNYIVNTYKPKIATLTNELRKIFTSDRGKIKTSNHGSRVNTRRIVDGKLHSNILLSRTMPKDLDNMIVYILIDKSGSMSKSNGHGKQNAQCAAETAICLYEALHAIRVPVYITGFTTRGDKALHVHYVTWNSPQSHKYTLANFAADDCNYDYFSISEATKVLRKHQAKHKLLIVISDGAPCNPSHGLHNMTGVDATSAAIEQARKTTSILGVAMNCYDEKIYAQMYGKDYITVSTANDMFIPVSETLQRIVKSW